MNKTPTGFVVYRGPSMLDGAPIVAIAIVSSRNAKTGDMVQTFIMREDVEPHTALTTGDDASVCGDCKHRPSLGGACYVRTFQGPLSVHRAYHRGNYPADDGYMAQTACTGRMVRLGTYGDPMAVPAEVWERLTRNAAGRTGYTHQWRNEAVGDDQRRRIVALCMASVDSMAEQAIAHASGLRYFRIRTADEPLTAREFVCPASEEAGKRKDCASCGACDGSQRGAKASPVIVVHGPLASRFARQRTALASA